MGSVPAKHGKWSGEHTPTGGGGREDGRSWAVHMVEGVMETVAEDVDLDLNLAAEIVPP